MKSHFVGLRTSVVQINNIVQVYEYVMLSEVEASPGRVPLSLSSQKKHNRTKKFDSNAKGFSVGGFTKSLHNIRKYIPDLVMLSSGNPFVWKPARNLCLHTRATAAQHNNGIFRMGAMRLV